VKRVYSQIISLLFVFCKLIAMQVWCGGWRHALLCFNGHRLYDFSKIGTVHLCVGCAGHLEEAENIIKAMPCKPYIVVWTALLGASRTHGNVEMGERVAKWITWIGAWKCCRLCAAAIKHLWQCCYWQLMCLQECWTAGQGKGCEDIMGLHRDWIEEWSAYIYSRKSRPISDDQKFM
jgi:hypothetical protein